MFFTVIYFIPDYWDTIVKVIRAYIAEYSVFYVKHRTLMIVLDCFNQGYQYKPNGSKQPYAHNIASALEGERARNGSAFSEYLLGPQERDWLRKYFIITI